MNWQQQLRDAIKKNPDFVFWDWDAEEVGEDLKVFIESLLSSLSSQIEGKLKEKATADWSKGEPYKVSVSDALAIIHSAIKQ